MTRTASSGKARKPPLNCLAVIQYTACPLVEALLPFHESNITELLRLYFPEQLWRCGSHRRMICAFSNAFLRHCRHLNPLSISLTGSVQPIRLCNRRFLRPATVAFRANRLDIWKQPSWGVKGELPQAQGRPSSVAEN